MTMRIVFLKNHDGYKPDEERFIDRQKAVEFCEKGVAVPFNLYEKIQKKRAEKKAAADLKAKEEKAKKAAKEKADKAKADLLLKKKSEKKTADSKKAFKRSKAIK